MFRVPNTYRIRNGAYGSEDDAGLQGAFSIPSSDGKIRFFVIASNGMDWEHVSVSVRGKRRCPTWQEMCYIKRMFWDSEDCVVQYHPAASDYVNNEPFTLHLWRPVGQPLPVPPRVLV